VEPSADVGLERYEDMLMQNLYKRLSQIDSIYFANNLDDEPRDGYRSSRDDETDAMNKDGGLGREMTAAAIRDSEYIQHSSNAGSDGFIHMTGGAGEGKQHLMPDGSVDNIKVGGMPPVKSDESLPFYCHPPNPCPKGLTSEDGCQEGIEDSADVQKEWINNMQQHGYCTCDHEHMFDCPDIQTLEHKIGADSRPSFNEVVDKILADNKAGATYMSGEKRETVVAKKSPRMKRSISADKMEQELKKVSEAAKKRTNPYLSGERLRTVAKKG
jgi:hypothetical protein